MHGRNTRGREVEVLMWPDDSERLDVLRAAGRPRLLFVPAGIVPPVVDGELEDWVRLPAPADDVRLRRRRLARLAREAGRSGAGETSAVTPTDLGRELPVL